MNQIDRQPVKSMWGIIGYCMQIKRLRPRAHQQLAQAAEILQIPFLL